MAELQTEAAGTAAGLSVQEQLAFLHSLIDSAQARAIVAVDSKGTIESWNRGARELYGYDAADILGRNLNTLWPDAQSIDEILVQARRSDHWDGESLQARKNGEKFLAGISVDVRRDPKGKPAGFTLIVHTIDQRQRSETTLREFLETAPDAMLVVNTRGQIAHAGK